MATLADELEVIDDAIEMMTDLPPGPVFSWVHLFDAPRPDDPPEPFATTHAGRPYDGEIAYAAAEVERLPVGCAARAAFQKRRDALDAQQHLETFGRVRQRVCASRRHPGGRRYLRQQDRNLHNAPIELRLRLQAADADTLANERHLENPRARNTLG